MSKLSSQSQHSQHSQHPPHQPQQQQQPQQYSSFSHPQVHSINPLQQSSQNMPNISQQQTQGIAIHPPSITSQIMSHHHPRPTAAATQIISAPFIDQSQYLAAIPVQPVIAPSTFPTSATIISPLPPPPDFVHSNVVLTPAQNQIQDHLQRKHEELQKLIVQQQDELRRVSEQLFMARYGLLPSIVNVQLPFVAPLEQTEMIEGRNIPQQSSYQEHHHHHQTQMVQHHVLSTPQSQVQNQQVQSTSVMMSQQPQQHMTIPYEMNPQKQQQQQQSHIEQTIESDASNSDIMQHYMQPTQSTNIHQMQPQQQQTAQQQQLIGSGDDFELIPFQMMNQQAQVLYATGSNNNNNNNNNSNNSANSNSANNNK
jgi:circadian locomoter output cycles kaput protein